VLFEPAEEGVFVVRWPALPGLVREGDTLEEARAKAEDVIRAYLESLRKEGLPLPGDEKSRSKASAEVGTGRDRPLAARLDR
jgi:predicted RNase H-like HicB family nuclease